MIWRNSVTLIFVGLEIISAIIRLKVKIGTYTCYLYLLEKSGSFGLRNVLSLMDEPNNFAELIVFNHLA